MIKGIGLDMIDLKRIQKAAKNPNFTKRILTEPENKLYKRYHGKRQIEFLAGRFAAKEAYAKANGTGFGTHLNFLDIEILQGENGAPTLSKPNLANQCTFISITHTAHVAVAQVIIEKRRKGETE